MFFFFLGRKLGPICFPMNKRSDVPWKVGWSNQQLQIQLFGFQSIFLKLHGHGNCLCISLSFNIFCLSLPFQPFLQIVSLLSLFPFFFFLGFYFFNQNIMWKKKKKTKEKTHFLLLSFFANKLFRFSP